MVIVITVVFTLGDMRCFSSILSKGMAQKLIFSWALSGCCNENRLEGKRTDTEKPTRKLLSLAWTTIIAAEMAKCE